MHRSEGTGGFAEALVVGGGNARLERIAVLMDWSRVEALLAPIHAHRTGQPAFRPLSLFKVLLLEGWYGLSDPAMEEALGDRLSFRRFCGLPLDEAVPDHSTISRFRSLLSRDGLIEQLFDEVVRQLDAHGLVVKAGTMVDATLIASAAAEPPRQRGGGRSVVDPDAAWQKHASGKAWFGYKLHVGVDRHSLIVRRARLTPANVAEVEHGHDLVSGDEAAVWADKGYVGPGHFTNWAPAFAGESRSESVERAYTFCRRSGGIFRKPAENRHFRNLARALHCYEQPSGNASAGRADAAPRSRVGPSAPGSRRARRTPNDQAAFTRPASVSSCDSSPLSYISIMMSDPPTNSPLT
jgi:transposase, IS5 family